uniref:OTU domain-containing protein n=1 Tax=viral metagenome TaxID=1070528 RepID=A0A6C0AFB3_9ZZZZ
MYKNVSSSDDTSSDSSGSDFSNSDSSTSENNNPLSLNKSEYKFIDSNLIDIYTIPDNSCYYHSILYALINTYRDKQKIKIYSENNNLKIARQQFCDNFRRSIINYLLTDNPEEDLILKIKFKSLEHLVNKYSRSNEYEYNQFNNNKVFEIFKNVYIDNNFYKVFIEECIYINSDSIATIITQKNINKILSENYITIISYRNKNEEIKINLTIENVHLLLNKIKKKLLNIFTFNEYKNIFIKCLNSIFENKNLKEFYLSINFKRENLLLNSLFDLLKKITSKIKFILCDKNSMSYKRFANHKIQELIEKVESKFSIAEKNLEVKKFFLNAIFIETKLNFTEKEYEDLLNIDPRKDFDIDSDNIIMKLPLSLNYFKLYNYNMIEKSTITLNDEGVFTLSIDNLVNIMLPKITENRIYRQDAGYDDFVPLMGEILNINIHIFHYNYHTNKLELIRNATHIRDKNLLNILILHKNGNHFETIGILLENNEYQTVFETNDPLIQELVYT